MSNEYAVLMCPETVRYHCYKCGEEWFGMLHEHECLTLFSLPATPTLFHQRDVREAVRLLAAS